MKNQDATGRTLEEVKEKNPVMVKMAELAEKASQWSPWKWISERREKALGTPLKDTLEAVMEEQQTPFADNLAAMRGQSVPARNLPEQLHEPETRVTKYGTDDYDKLYAPTKETALKDTIEAVKKGKKTVADKQGIAAMPSLEELISQKTDVEERKLALEKYRLELARIQSNINATI